MEPEFFNLQVDGIKVRVAGIQRNGERNPIFLLHGFGSTKEDYSDMARYPQFDGRSIFAFDAPGCGETECDDLSAISISYLQRTLEAVLERWGVQRFHLVGHSMGGLTALMFAHAHPGRPLSFTNIEGNVAPEDCFLSRQIINFPAESAKDFMEQFIERMGQLPGFSHPLYALGLRTKVRAEAIAPIFRSMVELSDHQDLMSYFLGLPFPRMFVYGDENSSLSYLANLQDNGVELAEIAHCGHFPMYSNPPMLWSRMADFMDRADKVCGDA